MGLIRLLVLGLAAWTCPLLLGGCSGGSIPSDRDILEAIQDAMNDSDRQLFQVDDFNRLNGFPLENNGYRVECQYNLKLIRMPPQNDSEKLEEEFNKLSDQEKMAVSQNPAYRLAYFGTRDQHSPRRKVASWGYQTVGDIVTFKGFFDIIPSERGWILNPTSRASLSFSTP